MDEDSKKDWKKYQDAIEQLRIFWIHMNDDTPLDSILDEQIVLQKKRRFELLLEIQETEEDREYFRTLQKKIEYGKKLSVRDGWNIYENCFFLGLTTDQADQLWKKALFDDLGLIPVLEIDEFGKNHILYIPVEKKLKK